MSVLDRLRWTYRAWRYRFRLEPREIKWLLRHLAPGDVAVDVGAHKGGYTWWMRRAVGAEGAVYAFEPQPALAEALRNLTSGPRYRNVVVENLGLSSASGEMTLHVPVGGPSPGASLEPRDEAVESYRVAVTTLDAYFDGPERQRIRLLKCDAEGHELEVFRGAVGVLGAARPALLFECEARHRPSGRVDEVFDWLAGRGYRGYFMGSRGPEEISRFDARRHQADQAAPGYVNNFLFEPRDVC